MAAEGVPSEKSMQHGRGSATSLVSHAAHQLSNFRLPTSLLGDHVPNVTKLNLFPVDPPVQRHQRATLKRHAIRVKVCLECRIVLGQLHAGFPEGVTFSLAEIFERSEANSAP